METTNPRERIARGNKVLLKLYQQHSSPDADIRKLSVPLIFFKRVRFEGRPKGNLQFQGFGIVERVELVTQFDRNNNNYFSNYVFDFAVLSLKGENEEFSWNWVNARRQKSVSIEQTVKSAPKAWCKWITEGPQSIGVCRRRVSQLLTSDTSSQRPQAGSREERALNDIYQFYVRAGRSRFEGLASEIAKRVLGNGSQSYLDGWVTPESNDAGIDFIGRLDLGTGFSKVKIIVLGQAKCEKPDKPTNGVHIARTVARLKRGWIGVYVTTSYFSEPVQREVIEDQYPILMINGLRLAQEVLLLVHENGYPDVNSYLEWIDGQYESKIQSRSPEEILHF